MLELTISDRNGNLILGVMNNNTIKYKKNGEGPINSVPFQEDRIIFYSKCEDGGRNENGGANLQKNQISMKPVVGYFPIVIKHNNEGQYIPGKIIDIQDIQEKVA